MTTVKFEEGTKFETSLNLEDGEGIIFVKPPKNSMYVMVSEGCLMGLLTIITLGIIRIFKPIKRWRTNLVVTNKRVVTIPMPPNKKNFPAESYYLKDILSVKAENVANASNTQRMSGALFNINMKDGAPIKETRKFTIAMEMSAKNILSVIGQGLKDGASDMANQFAQYNAGLQTYHNRLQAESTGASHYLAISHKVGKKDFSQTGPEDLRDFIVEVIDDCIEAAKNA